MVRGDVRAIALPGRRGHVQHGRRYGVVIQTDELLALSTVVICPTSTSTPPASFHPEILLVEVVGHLTRAELRAVEDAVELVLDLS